MANYKKSDFLRFLKSLSLIVIVLIICDLIIGRGLAYLYSKQKSGLLYRTTFSIDSTKADYIVVGSSRANHHYDSSVFEAELNSTFYNCGRDGQSALYSFAVISGIIKRYTPKLIIIDIRPDDFSEPENERLSTLLPYCENPAIRPYINYKGEFEDIKLLSHIYPYNSLLTNLIVGLNKKHDIDYKGYVKLDRLNKNKILIPFKEQNGIDSVKVNAFYEIMDKLSKKNIKTLVVLSPVHCKYTNSVTVDVCNSLTKKYPQSKILNYTNIPKWQNNELFSDDFHLNGKGAMMFSKELTNHIKQDFDIL